MTGYTVDLVLGPYRFIVAAGGAMDAGTDPVLVLDGLLLGWRYAAEGWPAALEPLQAVVGLATSRVAVLTDLDLGDVAAIRCTDSTGGVFAALYGTVNELVAEQRLRGHGPDAAVWTFYSVRVVDAGVANDTPVTFAAPAATQLGRVRDLAALAPFPIRRPPEGLTPTLTFKGAAIEESGVVELVRGYTAKGELTAPARGGWLAAATIVPPVAFLMLAPVCDPTGALRLLSLHAAYFTVYPEELPARLAVVDGLLRLVPVPGAPNAVPGDRVRLEGQWRKGVENSGDAVTLRDGTIAVTSYRDGMTAAQRATAIRTDRTVDDWTATRAELGTLGPLFLDEPRAPGWDREGFTYTPADPADLGDAFFPNWSTERFGVDVLEADPEAPPPARRTGTPAEPAAPCFTRPVAVFGIPDGANLAGGPGVYAGHLTAATLTIAAGRVTVEFAMRRQVHRPDVEAETAAFNAGLSYAELRTVAPAVPYRGPGVRVDPGVTLSDLRLVRD